MQEVASYRDPCRLLGYGQSNNYPQVARKHEWRALPSPSRSEAQVLRLVSFGDHLLT